MFITAKITSLSAVQIYDFHIFIVRYGLISNKYFEKISEVDVVLVKKSNQPSKEGFCVSVKVKQHPSALSISPYWLSQLNGFTSFLSFWYFVPGKTQPNPRCSGEVVAEDTQCLLYQIIAQWQTQARHRILQISQAAPLKMSTWSSSG